MDLNPFLSCRKNHTKSNLISLEVPGMNKDDAYIEVCGKEQQLPDAGFLLSPKTQKQTLPSCSYASVPACFCTNILFWQFC